MQASTLLDDLFPVSVAVPVYAKPFKTIHVDDWEPVTVIEPCIDKGPWIAGGAALRWWQGYPVGNSDIDIFCRNAKQVLEVINKITATGRCMQKYDSDNAATFSYWSKDSKQWTLQVIKRKHFNSMEEVIKGFDISVCEIGTCGTDWSLGPTTAYDINNKLLRFNEPLQPDAVKRLTKYWIYGYNPVPGTIESIQDNPEARWTFELDHDYHNAF